jgi:hypothetical protein
MQGLLEDELPTEKCKSSIAYGRRNIVKTDDPRWMAYERNWMKTSDALNDAAVAILAVKPTSIRGIAALLAYAAEYVEQGDSWPDDFVSTTATRRLGMNWTYGLHRMLANTLAEILHTEKQDRPRA